MGCSIYAVYRRRVVGEPLLATRQGAARRTVPPWRSSTGACSFRCCPGRASDDALDVAASLSAERGAQIAAVTVLEIPLDLPLSAELREEEARANRELDEARAIGDSYGVSVIPRLVRGRNAGAEIVREAERRGTEIIVIGAPRKDCRPAQARGLRAHGRLRAQERALPGDGDRDRRGGGVNLYRGVVAVLALLFVGIGIALLAVTAANGGGVLGFLLGAHVHRPRRRTADTAPEGRRDLVARKLRGFQRVLDAPALFSIAYGEIASSIYFALGIVAAYALGFTPLVLLIAGIVFLIVALSYAEGTAAIPETGGAATFVRRAFNDLFGFLTGWALFLDYLIVIALSTLFLPALPRDGAERGRAARLTVGCGDRRSRDRHHRRHPARAPLRSSTPAGSRSPGSTSRRSSCS